MNKNLAEHLVDTADTKLDSPFEETSGALDVHTRIAQATAAPMVLLSLSFLTLIAVLLVLDVAIDAPLPELSVTAMDSATAGTMTGSYFSDPEYVQRQAARVVNLMLIIWPIFWVEHLYSKFVGRRRGYQGKLSDSLVCLIPPLRLMMPCPAMYGQVWLPIVGWRAPGRTLHRKLERTLSKPMLFIGLLILPVLLVEGSLAASMSEKPGLALGLRSATALIWLAFAAEFILMVNTTEKKLAYVKSHWLELAIIILPLISFLRFLRILPASRLVSVHKFAKMAKTYRMRGVIGRTFRALALLEVVSRLLRENPQSKLSRLKEKHEEKYQELVEMRIQIGELEAEMNPHEKITAAPGDMCTDCLSKLQSAGDNSNTTDWRSAA